jgi:hypothetical protein
VVSHPFVLAYGREAVPLGEVLDRQVTALREAHRIGGPVAAQLLRGTGTKGTDDELLGSALTEEAARLAVALDHGYADWDAARANADVIVDTRFEAAADAACLLRHVVRQCGRGLTAPREVDPDDVMMSGGCPGHRAPRGARSPRSVNEQQRRRLPRAVVDHVHSVRVLSVVITHARDDTGLPAISLGQMSAPWLALAT